MVVYSCRLHDTHLSHHYKRHHFCGSEPSLIFQLHHLNHHCDPRVPDLRIDGTHEPRRLPTRFYRSAVSYTNHHCLPFPAATRLWGGAREPPRPLSQGFLEPGRPPWRGRRSVVWCRKTVVDRWTKANENTRRRASEEIKRRGEKRNYIAMFAINGSRLKGAERSYYYQFTVKRYPPQRHG